MLRGGIWLLWGLSGCDADYCDYEAMRADACGVAFDTMACRSTLDDCRDRDQRDLIAYSQCIQAEGIGVCEACTDRMLTDCEPDPVGDPALGDRQQALDVCRDRYLSEDTLSAACFDELNPGCSTAPGPGWLGLLGLALLLLARRDRTPGCSWSPRRASILTMLCLSSCLDVDLCVTTFFVDLDGDGYGDPATAGNRCGTLPPQPRVPVGGDCDDGDPTRHPGAPEVCDGIDNDCDGDVEEEQLDRDGDGWTPCDGDCNDFDPDIRPGAFERCNGRDDDCDGLAEVVGPQDDDDLDGDGFSVCDGDCDDADALIAPLVFDDCGGGDENCDGIIDDGIDPHEPNDVVSQAVVLDVVTRDQSHEGAFPHEGDLVDRFQILADAGNVGIRISGRAVEVEVRAGDSVFTQRFEGSVTPSDDVLVTGSPDVSLAVFPVGGTDCEPYRLVVYRR